MRPRNWLVGLALLHGAGNAAVAAETFQRTDCRSTRNGGFLFNKQDQFCA
jgi:hypothetical protein